jgi:hypothetical protein
MLYLKKKIFNLFLVVKITIKIYYKLNKRNFKNKFFHSFIKKKKKKKLIYK